MRMTRLAAKWFCLLAALAPAPSFSVYRQAQKSPTWVVIESEDLKGGLTYKDAVSKALSEEFAKTMLYDVVPYTAVRQAIKELGERVNESNFILSYWLVREFKANVVVMSALVDYRVRRGNGKKRAAATVYVVAYNGPSGLSISGALVKSESAVMDGEVPDREVVADALRQAASLAVEQMRSHKTPKALISSAGKKKASIDHGSREGFHKGDLVQIVRGAALIGTARVRVVGLDNAEIVYERAQEWPLIGDKVEAVFKPPPFPDPLTVLFERRPVRF